MGDARWGVHLFITRWAVFLMVEDSQWQVIERRNGGHELLCLTTRHQAAVVLSIRFRSKASVNVIEIETDLGGGLRLEFHRCR